MSLKAKERTIALLLSIKSTNRQEGKRAAIALSRIYAYFRAAHCQVRLIETYERRADPKRDSYSADMIQAFTHVHLYFICWASIGRMIEVIRRCSGLETPNRIWKRYRTTLERYAEARNHFEHYEERLPGGKKSAGLANPTDYGNLHAGCFSLGGYRWDVSMESLKKLEIMVSDLARDVCLEAYAKANVACPPRCRPPTPPKLSNVSS